MWIFDILIQFKLCQYCITGYLMYHDMVIYRYIIASLVATYMQEHVSILFSDTCFCDPIVVYSAVTTVAAVDDICLTYIVIRIIQIDQMFCGGNVTYNTTVSPPNDQIKIIKSETMHKITGLTNNTNYSITTVALRRGGIIHQDIMNNSTLQSQSKYI